MDKKRLYLKIISLILLGSLGVFSVLVLTAYLLFGRGGAAPKIKWGASFDAAYAESLGLDWKKTYLSLLNEVGVDHLRLVAFWNAIEPEDNRFDFSALDFQMVEAQKRGVGITLAVGRRLPRWPECHIPDWAAELSEKEQQGQVLESITAVVNRYRESPHLEYWQVENEPFVGFFGECSELDRDFFWLEIDNMAHLDSFHP